MQQFEAREIGARIRQARNERGLTQEDLAELGSFSKRSLQDYEAGNTIPYRQLRELSRLLGRPTEWFLYGEGETKSSLDERVEALLDRFEKVVERLEQAAAARQHARAG